MASNPMSAEITVQYLLLRIIEWKSDRGNIVNNTGRGA